MKPPTEAHGEAVTLPPHRSGSFASWAGKTIVCAALAAAGFAATCLVTGRFFPMRQVDEVSTKLQYFRAHQDEFDTLLIGSSHVYTQIDPTTFDATMSEQGVESHSYNFGITGLSMPELYWLVDHILQTPTPRLKRVIIEFGSDRTIIPDLFKGTARESYWHDFPRTWIVTRDLATLAARNLRNGKPGELPELGSDLLEHWKLCLSNATNIGRVNELIAATTRTAGKHPVAPAGSEPRGFHPLPQHLTGKTLETWRQKLADHDHAPHPNGIILRSAFERMLAQLQSTGAQPFFFISPNIDPATVETIPFAESEHLKLLAFDSPTLYPQLFREENRADLPHLNAGGAEIFTRILATQVAQNSPASASSQNQFTSAHALR